MKQYIVCKKKMVSWSPAARRDIRADAIATCCACNINTIHFHFLSSERKFAGHVWLHLNANEKSKLILTKVNLFRFVSHFIYGGHCDQDVRNGKSESFQSLFHFFRMNKLDYLFDRLKKRISGLGKKERR